MFGRKKKKLKGISSKEIWLLETIKAVECPHCQSKGTILKVPADGTIIVASEFWHYNPSWNWQPNKFYCVECGNEMNPEWLSKEAAKVAVDRIKESDEYRKHIEAVKKEFEDGKR